METMTAAEQAAHNEATQVVRSCVSSLRLSRLTADEDESGDIRTALARLENWLAENDGRWVK